MQTSKKLEVTFTPSKIRNRSDTSSLRFSEKVWRRKILEITPWLREPYDADA